MSLQDTDRKELQENGEDDSITWQTYAVENLVILESVIQEETVLQKDILPNQLLQMANAILKTLPGIDSLKNPWHKKDFERLLGEASTLVVILLQFNIKDKVMYHSLEWPPPKLKDLVNELVDTTCRIHKLMKRKSEKNLAKRVLLGCFGIRDLGKFNIYQRKLGNMASCLQSKPHNINIHTILLAVVHSRLQPQDGDCDSELTGELTEGDLPDKKGAKKDAAGKKATAEGSRLCEVGKSTLVKPVKSGDNQRKSCKAKVNMSRTSSRFSQMDQNEAKDNSERECDEERAEDNRRIDRRTSCNEENQDGDKTMRYDPDEANLVERTSAQSFRSNNTAQSKTRKEPSQEYEDEENIWVTAPKPKCRSRTDPVTSLTRGPSPRHQVGSFSFANGSGIMINENIGNIFNLTTTK